MNSQMATIKRMGQNIQFNEQLIPKRHRDAIRDPIPKLVGQLYPKGKQGTATAFVGYGSPRSQSRPQRTAGRRLSASRSMVSQLNCWNVLGLALCRRRRAPSVEILRAVCQQRSLISVQTSGRPREFVAPQIPLTTDSGRRLVLSAWRISSRRRLVAALAAVANSQSVFSNNSG
jgi:hypothetical protein